MKKKPIKCESDSPNQVSVGTNFRIVGQQEVQLIKIDKLKFILILYDTNYKYIFVLNFFFSWNIYIFSLLAFICIVSSHFMPNFITVGPRKVPYSLNYAANFIQISIKRILKYWYLSLYSKISYLNIWYEFQLYACMRSQNNRS